MSRQSEKLYDGITGVGGDLIEKAQRTPEKKRRKWYRWAGPVAAVLAVAILVGVFSGRGGLTAYAIAEAEYPKERVWVDLTACAGTLDGFLTKSIPQFLSGAGGGNRVYSPINVYMALSMLAEVTDGNTRKQILDLLGAEDIETQRERANLIWNRNYLGGKTGKCILASSLWLNRDVHFVQSTMDTLADCYYASSYRGEMGSDSFNKALQGWLNEQTGNLLKEQADNVTLNKETVMAIATTVYFRDKWSSEFNKSATKPGVFHAPGDDVTRDFMHKNRMEGAYYWGEKFSSVPQYFKSAGTMWYILPDEGVTPDELLGDAQFLAFLSSDWEGRKMDHVNSKRLFINLAVPKFDVVSDLDLLPGLAALGVTDALDWSVSNFSPMTTDTDEICLSAASHAARVIVDEEGCVAVAYTVEADTGAAMPPDDEIDFVLDRPFLFAITGNDGLPLFVGVVNDPIK